MPPCGEERALSRDEQQRLAALHEYRVLDAPADDELEAVVRVAAMVAGVPTATLNLIDEHRQCQLTTAGFTGGDSARSDSMCALRFRTGQFVHVRDARTDPTYRDNPWVTGVLADVRFYASAPLVTPQGHALGTLCVFDSVPRELTGEQIERLEDLAGVILALFERRRQARVMAELAAEAEARQRFTDTVLDTIDVAVVAADRSGHLTVFNRAARDWHGLDADPSIEPADFAAHYRLLDSPAGDELEAVVRVAATVARVPTATLNLIDENRQCQLTTSGFEGGDSTRRDSMCAIRFEAGDFVWVPDAGVDPTYQDNPWVTGALAKVRFYASAPLITPRELLADEQPGSGRVQAWIATATRAVARMQRLIEALLTSAQAGSDPCRSTTAGLADLAEHAVTDPRGGRIWVDGTPGGGATVTFTLPDN